MTYKLNSANNYSLDFSVNESDRSVLQNVALLFSTKQGTVPMFREFGLPMEFVDKPQEAAEIIAYAEMTEALDRYEPRATLIDITFDKNKNGEMCIIVEVSINDESQ